MPYQIQNLGFISADPGHAISDISQGLEAIETSRKTERELADEYKTLLQARRYVKLADEPRFVKGPKWGELLQEESENTKVMTTTEHSTELSKKNQHPDGKESVNEEPQKRKTFMSEINI